MRPIAVSAARWARAASTEMPSSLARAVTLESMRSVRMEPGHTLFTRMPSRPTSSARLLAKATTPIRVAPESARFGIGWYTVLARILMKRQKAGRIINILASTVYQPIPNLALSGATRMGVVAFAKSLADEVGRDGILVNNVCPGSILTERMLSNVTARAKELGLSVDEALAQRAAETAIGRIGEPREMAYLVAFLASGKAGYITGTTILVDGGLVRSVL